ncbi:uncharacterized protein BHQ10_009145 [Talaromyces amestolkiae]|uniref:Cyanovirin-N domain-containing protein n=1 Tax=Talaromyces amestolkiae TaxID=1196081 RepID=A0A364LBJ6_TALAM|nr:uncharacterized protein BHQ10_009145 [Talaromyces amestolkiae]RAO73133.1 hypothetical protein BHQ10_009145 [Talaromyces amestolkiae]
MMSQTPTLLSILAFLPLSLTSGIPAVEVNFYTDECLSWVDTRTMYYDISPMVNSLRDRTCHNIYVPPGSTHFNVASCLMQNGTQSYNPFDCTCFFWTSFNCSTGPEAILSSHENDWHCREGASSFVSWRCVGSDTS